MQKIKLGDDVFLGIDETKKYKVIGIREKEIEVQTFSNIINQTVRLEGWIPIGEVFLYSERNELSCIKEFIKSFREWESEWSIYVKQQNIERPIYIEQFIKQQLGIYNVSRK